MYIAWVPTLKVGDSVVMGDGEAMRVDRIMNRGDGWAMMDLPDHDMTMFMELPGPCRRK